MKALTKVFAGGVLAIVLIACSQQTGEEAPAAAVAAPTETADVFVARVNEEFMDYWRELNAA